MQIGLPVQTYAQFGGNNTMQVRQYLTMTRRLIQFALLCGLLFHIIAASEPANKAGIRKRINTENREKLLKEFEEFESHVSDTITSIINNLHHEDDDCAETDKDAHASCPKPPAPEFLQDDDMAARSLLERLESIEEAVLAVAPRDLELILRCYKFPLINMTSSEDLGEIYYATEKEGIRVTSTKVPKVMTIVNGTDRERFVGVAADMLGRKIYWTSYYKIYTSEMDGTGTEMLLHTSRYGTLWGLGFDWITGNLYLVSGKGFILACGNGKPAGKFRCATVLSGQGRLRGIALNPNEGIMYWTKVGGSIEKSGMDGTDPHTLVSGSNYLMGIVIDFNSARIYWADYSSKRIQSCSPNGEDVKTIAQVSGRPWGIAIVRHRIYWSLYDEQRIESGAISGGDVRSSAEGASSAISNLAAPDWTLTNLNLTNPCCTQILQTCSGVCVLTSKKSYRCIP